jgi:hypothetical protein
MKESANSKIHISSNFLLSICLLIMLDTLLLGPSLHCNTSLQFTLHPATLHYTYRHLTYSHLHFTTLSFFWMMKSCNMRWDRQVERTGRREIEQIGWEIS